MFLFVSYNIINPWKHTNIVLNKWNEIYINTTNTQTFISQLDCFILPHFGRKIARLFTHSLASLCSVPSFRFNWIVRRWRGKWEAFVFMFSVSARFWFTDFLLAWFDVVRKWGWLLALWFFYGSCWKWVEKLKILWGKLV